MTLTLYYTPFTSSTTVHWALEELGIPYEAHLVDLKGGAQKKPEYLALNPNGKVPTLVDGKTAIFESLAILIHVGQQYGVDRHLWPRLGTKEHMEALSWTTWSVVTLGANAFSYFANTADRFPAEQRNAAHAQAAHRQFLHHLDLLEQRLTQHAFLGGPQFSLVDIPSAVLLAFTQRWQLSWAGHPHVQAWFEACWHRAARRVAWPSQEG